jgi:hypothetical protein
LAPQLGTHEDSTCLVHRARRCEPVFLSV